MELAVQKNSTPIDLAEALWNADQEEPGSLQKVVNETGLGRRRAFYLKKIWGRFADLDIDRSLLVELGWKKLSLVAKYSPAGKERRGLKLAQKHTSRALEMILRGGTADMAEAHSVLLWLDPPQYKVFADVLLKFGATYAGRSKALVGREEALTHALGTILDQQTGMR
jgi:hypothetical protein